MKQKLHDIYSFLKLNRDYNMPVQLGAYKMALLPYDTTFDKVYALLFNTLNSQSQVNMNKSAVFFQRVSLNEDGMNTFSSFLNTIGAKENTPVSYKSLFELLTQRECWGNKTAALFTKAVYHCHAGYANKLRFWDDAPTILKEDDELFLPVDAVISHIFKLLGNPCKNNFSGINTYLKNNVPKSDFDIWDDLWFWGFITQKGGLEARTMIFNEEKYWNLLDTPKDIITVTNTKKLANQFIDLIQN